MAIGKVKWYNARKGYGFIEPEDGATDIFVHVTAVERSGITNLDPDQKVEYELAEVRGRQAAVSIKLID